MRGRVLFSFDVELGWGAVENGKWAERERKGVYYGVRSALTSLLESFRCYEIGAVWAFVGKLFDCAALTDDNLPENVRSMSGKHLEGSTWRGDDILEKVLAAGTGHEVACHSFFHNRFQAKWMNRELAFRDIALCRDVFSQLGIHPISFIYPANQVAHVEALSRNGFLCYRARNETEDVIGGKWRRKMIGLGRLSGVLPVRTPAPWKDGAAWALPGSLLFNLPQHRRPFLPGLRLRALRALRRVAREGGDFHVWAHPYNFAENPDLISAFAMLLNETARLRDAGRVEVLTMAELQGRLNAGETDDIVG